MPARLSAGDRRLGMGAMAVAVAILVIMFVLAPPSTGDSPVPSVYSATKSGARAAYLLLREMHYDVRVWEEPPYELPRSAQGKMLILAEPGEIPTDQDRKALHDFVASGGRVLFCGGGVPSYFREARVAPDTDPQEQKFMARIPGALSRGARTIWMRPEARWRQEHNTQLAVYGDAVVLWRIGEGQVIWWGGASPLTNTGLKRGDNLTFFLNSLADWSTGKPLTIYWDEYFHGERTGLISYAERTPLPWGAAQLLIAACLVMFTFSRRSGPVMAPAVEPRLSPLEFVDTMGGLYERAGASSIPVAVYYQNLRMELTRRLNLPRDASDVLLARNGGTRLGIPEGDLRDALGDAERYLGLTASRVKVARADALGTVRKLSTCLARLRSPQSLEETN